MAVSLNDFFSVVSGPVLKAGCDALELARWKYIYSGALQVQLRVVTGAESDQ